MPPIIWSSLIADDHGHVQYARVKSLVAILLAFLGALVAIAAGVVEVVGNREVHTDAVLISVGALVLPLTGGVVASGLQLKKQEKADKAESA